MAVVDRSTEAAGVIRLFGAFAMDFAGAAHDESIWRRVHARRLFQMLGSAPKLVEPRSRVLELLWPGFDEPRARNRLHHTIHWIRKGLEPVPQALRPNIHVGTDTIRLDLPPGTLVDVQQFVEDIQADDATGDEARLAQIEHALAWYRGEFAPDWTDCTDLDARRARLVTLYEGALAEAMELACALSRYDVALHHGQRRADILADDVQAQCDYARVLADAGRADAALLHCRKTRQALSDQDPQGVAELDALMREIQQRVNQATAAAAPRMPPAPAAEHGHTAAAAAPALAPPAAGIAALPPAKSLIGHERPLRSAIQCLDDPYVSVVALVGPPGAGKTALALGIAHRPRGQWRNGVVWVDAAGANASELLAPRVGAALAEAGFGAGSADAATLVRQLAGKEMLLVIDGLEDASQTAPLLSQLCGASSDLSILVTAWSAPRLRAEKAIFVDASQLVQAADEPQGSAAARLLAGAGHHQWTLSDKRIRAGVERIALACDGLPMLLEAASHMLQTMWPNELLARLDRDAATLVREAGDGGERLVRWLQAAPADARALLALIGRCRSWVTREDIVTLMHPQDEGAVAAAVDYCVRQHYLLRRVRQTHQGAWSEFRVPRFVQATLAACQQTLPMAEALAHVSRWLAAGPQPPDGDSVQAAAWFDDRIDDFDAVVHEWQTLARHEDVAALLLPHAAAWPQSAQGERVLGWLAGLGERLEPVGNAAAARLHLERARLRAQFGQLHGAFEDAGHALARLEQAPDASLRQEALKLMERYGSGEAAGRFPRALDERGIEAGESLLRVAQLSLRHGAMPKALQLAGEAAGVFNYFGLTRGLLKAHQLRAKIAFGMGDLVTAQQCVVHAERTARALGDGDEDAHAQIVRCHLLMAEMQMARAVELASAVMAKPDCAGKPRLLARGLLAMGWAQYAMGALPVAKAMCNELAAVTRESNSASLHLQTEVLATLIDARQGRPEAARRRVSVVLDLQTHQAMEFDSQGDWINLAELMFHLGRLDLAAAGLDALAVFARRPEHRLRPWVEDRMQHLRAHVPERSGAAAAADESATLNELLLQLVLN